MTWFAKIRRYEHEHGHVGIPSSPYDGEFEFNRLAQKLIGTRFYEGDLLIVPLDLLVEPDLYKQVIFQLQIEKLTVKFHSRKFNRVFRLSPDQLVEAPAHIYADFSRLFNYRGYDNMYHMPMSTTTNSTSSSAVAPVNYTGYMTIKDMEKARKEKEVKKEETEKLSDSLFKVQVMKLKQDE